MNLHQNFCDQHFLIEDFEEDKGRECRCGIHYIWQKSDEEGRGWQIEGAKRKTIQRKTRGKGEIHTKG